MPRPAWSERDCRAPYANRSRRGLMSPYMSQKGYNASAAGGKSKRTGVYSTDGGDRCRQCLRARKECVCGAATPAPVAGAAARGSDGIVRLARETKGRKGGGVTLVTGLPLSAAELEALASRLKKLCGVGGTVRDGVIEIQGEQRARLQPELEKLGYKVKIAGG